jgi:hypothetical protein
MEEREEGQKNGGSEGLKSFRSVVVALALAGCALQAKEPIAWRHAKVISQDMESSPGGVIAVPIGNMAIAAPITRRSNVIELETNKAHIRLIEQKMNRGPIILPVNATIDFYLEEKSGRFIILDFKKHKHIFGVIGIVAK